MRTSAAIVAGLVALVALLVGCDTVSGPQAAGTCDVVGLRNIDADDPNCVQPPEWAWPQRHQLTVDGHLITFAHINGNSAGSEYLLPMKSEDEIRQYQHIRVQVLRYADQDLIIIQGSDSDSCAVETWTELTKLSNGYCSFQAPDQMTLVPVGDVGKILPTKLIDWLIADSASQGNTIKAFALDVVTPRMGLPPT